ncbi:unnamed protein product [Lactuca saligna]|uniref:Uncharacterized protein n=1 Tax=Lactuca saligna TaxID=75948 RepID=A0AA35Z424_LACSI|nr:unnamed protein product [Lactuca saligna]
MIANGHSMGGLCIGPGGALAPCLISKASDKKSKSICILRCYPVPPPSSLVATSLPCSVAARWSRHSPPQQLSPEISFLKLVSPFTTLLSLELVVASGVPCCRRCALYDFISLPHKVGTMAGGAVDCQFWHRNLGIKGSVQSKRSLLLELQHRSTKFDSIIEKHQNIRFALVERKPVLDKANFSRRRNGSTYIPSTSMGSSVPNGVIKTTVAPLVDLLDLGGGEEPPPPNTNSMMTGDNFLQDLLDVGMSPSSSQPG